MLKFPFYKQHDANDCGPSCVRMIAKHYGKHYTLETLRQRSYISRDGVSLLGISDAAESIGFRTEGVKISFDVLCSQLNLPAIVHWNQKHFVVVYKIRHNKVWVADPAHGLIKYPKDQFLKHWASDVIEGEPAGICLQLEPSPDFYESYGETKDKGSIRFLFSYLKGYSKLITQLALGIFLAIAIQFIFPFLFQAMIDKGVVIPNLSLLTTILIAQLVLVTSRFLIGLFRNWILLHLGTRINIFLVSDFLVKLMKLPVSYFDGKTIGDLIQRVNDHKRIEVFLTRTSLNLFYSLLTIIIMGGVLAVFSLKIFLVFLGGTILYTLWAAIFMRRRRQLDNKQFAQLSDNQNTLIQLIEGMPEIKLNNCEKQKRWEWESIQAKLFGIHVKSLLIQQRQEAGALFFNEFKDVVVIFIAATMVGQGMTLGGVVAISYILGQLSGPLNQLINFFHTTQDAKISLERLAEIHKKDNEESDGQDFIAELPNKMDLAINKLSFQYEGPHSPFVLKSIDLLIPEKKVTAIVGTSGSGKTTLLKLLLKFYHPIEGNIQVDGIDLNNFSSKIWRANCGVVMQDGYIFSDTIARNIAVSEEQTDKMKLVYASKVANLEDVLENLPLGFNTKIGQEGLGLSVGQKQRILIARAVYKQPEYLFFDEATNSLDANNEKVIMENLDEFFEGRTVVVVAHRLSTVKNADQIVVLDRGRIVEIGAHQELIKKQGAYYKLVKNQLELGA